MVEEYPNWSLVEYFMFWVGLAKGVLGNATDFWSWLAGLFFGVAFGLGFIPLSILWFIVKNKGRVGGLTWALVIITPIIGFVWMALA